MEEMLGLKMTTETNTRTSAGEGGLPLTFLFVEI